MVRNFTLALGLVLIAAGLAGMATGRHDHQLMVFGVNTTHNTVHILSGLAAVLAAWFSARAAKSFCLAFGIVYGLVTIAGFANASSAVSLLNLNTPDNYLHLAITAACLYFGLRRQPVYSH